LRGIAHGNLKKQLISYPQYSVDPAEMPGVVAKLKIRYKVEEMGSSLATGTSGRRQCSAVAQRPN
jgi:hypothetical protein